jgi:CheY-like chemotaxis protein
MNSSESILLLSSEEDVIKDVVCSLSLVNLPVVITRNLNEARTAVSESVPKLILTRLAIKGNDKAGLDFARILATEINFSHIPVVALLRKGEQDLLQADADSFAATIYLPVEFPTFTQQVQDVLTNTTINTSYGGALSASVNEKRTEATREQKLELVNHIHASVLDWLEKSQVFASAHLEDVPSLLAHITNEVCIKFEQNK